MLGSQVFGFRVSGFGFREGGLRVETFGRYVPLASFFYSLDTVLPHTHLYRNPSCFPSLKAPVYFQTL